MAIPLDLNRAFQFWSRSNKQGEGLQKQTLVINFFGKSIKSDGKHIPERGLPDAFYHEEQVLR